jgi:hypothetical protein
MVVFCSSSTALAASSGVQWFSQPQPVAVIGAQGGVPLTPQEQQTLASVPAPTPTTVSQAPPAITQANIAAARRFAHRQLRRHSPLANAAQPQNAYELVNENSSLCLDVYGYSLSNGANIDQYGCNGRSNQYWVLDQVGTYYGLPLEYIVSLHGIDNNLSLCVDVYHASLSEGADIYQWGCNGHADQVWIDANNSPWDWFTNYNSGYVMEVYGASKSWGAQVDQWAWNGNANQKWCFCIQT